MVMEELLLVNPEDAEPRRHRRKAKFLQIIFPKPVRRIRANPEYPETADKKGKTLIGRFTGKHVAGALGGAAATIAKAAGLKDWGDVIGSGAVAIGGGFAIKQVDEGAGEAFVLTGLGVTGLKAVTQLIRTAKGATGKKKTRVRRSLGEDEILGIDDLGEEELLGAEEDLLGDIFGEADELLDVGNIADFGEEVIDT